MSTLIGPTGKGSKNSITNLNQDETPSAPKSGVVSKGKTYKKVNDLRDDTPSNPSAGATSRKGRK
jgi:hypothetical protein